MSFVFCMSPHATRFYPSRILLNMKQVCVREISILNVKPLIIFIFRGLFLVKFDCLIIYIDILQYFLIFNWHSLTLLSKLELVTSPLIAKLYT